MIHLIALLHKVLSHWFPCQPTLCLSASVSPSQGEERKLPFKLVMISLADHAKSLHWLFQLPPATIKGDLTSPPLQATRKDPKSNNSKLAMRRLAAFFILVLLILLTEVSPGQGGGVKDVIKPAYPLNKMRPRKVLVEVTLDYDYGGPNNRHDPKKGKPGIGGGKNP